MHHQVTNYNQYDVIVIGAGFAGLTAAYYLKEKDTQLNILIIEAKSCVGGRAQTVQLKVDKQGNKANFDIGGQWVYILIYTYSMNGCSICFKTTFQLFSDN